MELIPRGEGNGSLQNLFRASARAAFSVMPAVPAREAIEMAVRSVGVDGFVPEYEPGLLELDNS